MNIKLLILKLKIILIILSWKCKIRKWAIRQVKQYKYKNFYKKKINQFKKIYINHNKIIMTLIFL